MSDIVERIKALEPYRYEKALADGTESYNDDPCEYYYAEKIVALHSVAAEAAAEITRLQAELAEARDKALDEAAETMENLSFMTDISDLIGMTKQEMSVRTCHEGAQASRALKSPKPPIL